MTQGSDEFPCVNKTSKNLDANGMAKLNSIVSLGRAEIEQERTKNKHSNKKQKHKMLNSHEGEHRIHQRTELINSTHNLVSSM